MVDTSPLDKLIGSVFSLTGCILSMHFALQYYLHNVSSPASMSTRLLTVAAGTSVSVEL